MKENTSRYLFGILVILIGFSLLLDGLGIIPSVWYYFRFFITNLWPIIFIIFAIKFFISKDTTIGLLFALLGISFFANSFFDINFSYVIWPLIIMGIGVSLFFNKEKKKEKEKEERVNGVEKKDSYFKTVVFGEEKKKIESKDFKGGELNVAFSKVVLDLREVIISKKGSKIHINCALSEVLLFVPKGCRIKSKGNGVLGDWKVELEKRNELEPTLEISGTALLGSVRLRD
jgi:predicted membrane protein